MSTFNKVFFALLVVAFSGSSNAALMTENGATVSFTFDDSLLGLFGTPVVAGDSLKFNPVAFNVSAPAADYKYSDSTIVVTINALYGATLNTLGLQESGDYKLFGTGAYVAAKGTLTDSASYQGSSYFFTDASGTSNLMTSPWSGNASLDYNANTTSTVVSLNNFLFASAVGHQLALINKYDVNLSAYTTASAIPLPLTVWMFGAGLFGMLSVSKRKKML